MADFRTERVGGERARGGAEQKLQIDSGKCRTVQLAGSTFARLVDVIWCIDFGVSRVGQERGLLLFPHAIAFGPP